MKVRKYLGLTANIIFSSEITSTGKRDENLLLICKCLNATHYLSGDTAKKYLRETIFTAEGIKVE